MTISHRIGLSGYVRSERQNVYDYPFILYVYETMNLWFVTVFSLKIQQC